MELGLRPRGSGLLFVASPADVAAEERRQAEARQSEPVVQSLAAHVRSCWEAAHRGRQEVEAKMLAARRQRRGEYDPAKLAQIRKTGGSEIFMMLTAVKCRAAESWIRDTLMPAGDRPWTIEPTPLPDLTPDEEMQLRQSVEETIWQEGMRRALAAGLPEDIAAEQVMQAMPEMAEKMRDLIDRDRQERAKAIADKMADKIEDVLVEGGWVEAFDALICDLTTYPAAFLAGPIIRRRKVAKWVKGADGRWGVEEKDEIVTDVERVSPLDMYPSPWSTSIDDGYLIRRHRLSRADLAALKGVSGYDDTAINAVLDEYGRGGLREWLTQGIDAETRRDTGTEIGPDRPIDALEFWGSVPGSMLIEWGMDAEQVPDPSIEVDCCIWLIGRWVIKAMLNPDFMGRKPFFKASYEIVPGEFWGRAVPELIEDSQAMCNAAARALANNMGIACLTGDTVVYRHDSNGRKYSEITINELFAKKSDHNSGLRRIKLRCLNEETGELFYNRIVDVIDNGVRDVYEVKTARGYRIKSTIDHRFIGDNGEWKALESFSVGDRIAVNGRAEKPKLECIDCGAPLRKPTAQRCKACAAKVSRWNLAQAEAARHSKDGTETTARARKVCQSQKKDACEICGATARLHVHHKDRDPWNNEPGNLQTLCEPCHVYVHLRTDNIGDPYKHRFVDYDEIISITHLGPDRVFDLAMEAPHHNFVANGFIAHNCGPQVEVNVDRLPDGERIDAMYPWKIWQTTSDKSGNGHPAIRFFQPEAMVNDLIGIFDRFSRIADDESGVPSYSYGDAKQGGAAATASGLSMLFNASGKGIKSVIANLDSGIIAPVIGRLYDHLMRYDPDDSIKGDLRVVARGASSLIVREQMTLRRQEFLAATANPLDSQIMGVEGRAELLREQVKSLDMPADRIIPGREEIAAKMQEASAAAAQQAQALPAPGRQQDAAGDVAGGQDERIAE